MRRKRLRKSHGTRSCHTVYAKSEEECEGLLAEMIEKVKGEREENFIS